MTTKRVKRKLTAILSADVKGYSRLMGEDEEATVRTLTAYRQIMASLIQQYRGRVVDSPGDNLLSEFASVVDAVQCAVEIQQVLKAKNDDLPENRRMEFRIGINLGDVIEEEERIYGDGVNIAARVEGLAKAGGICISGSAHEQIKNKLALGYEYLGEHSVKNIAEPVRVYRVQIEPEAKTVEKRAALRRWQWATLAVVGILVIGAGALAIWNFYLRPAPIQVVSEQAPALELPDRPSIAVLPFTNLSGDPEQEYFSDGITDDIITALSKLRGLMVVARHSTFTYKGKRVDVRQVGRDLGVRYVLEGGVQRILQQTRINVQLIDTATGDHIWAERYDREFKDIFAVQDDITQKIITELEVQLVEGEMARIWRNTTNNPEAYDYYLRGRELQQRFTREYFSRAKQLLEKTLELDPQFTGAMTYLGWLYYNAAVAGWSESPAESFDRARAWANRAIEVGDFYGEAYLILCAISLSHELNHEQAIAYGEQAVALNPVYGQAYAILSLPLSYGGRAEEGLANIKKAYQLTPIPWPVWDHILGAAHLFLGEYEEAIAAYRNCLDNLPNYIWCNVNIIIAYMETGREAEARAQSKEVLRINPKFNTETAVQVRRIKDPATRERWKSLLRKAGLP